MYQKQAGFLPPKTLPTYEGSYLHALHGFFRKLKNENHQAQFAYMKSMSKKTEIQHSYMDFLDFLDKPTD